MLTASRVFAVCTALALAACDDDDGSAVIVTCPAADAAPPGGDAAVLPGIDADVAADGSLTRPDAAPGPSSAGRLVVVVTPLGLHHPDFAMTFPGTDPAAGFEAPLVDSSAWSTTLAPLRELRGRMVVVDGLAAHRLTAKGVSDPVVDLPASVLTGAAGPSSTPVGPSLDWLVARAMPLGLREPLVLGKSSAAVSLQAAGVPARPLADAATAGRFLFPDDTCLLGPSRDTYDSIGLVAAMLACDRTRVATLLMPLPRTEELGLPPGGDLHADYAAVLGASTPAQPAPPEVRAGFVAWNVFAAKQVAALATRLGDIRTAAGGTLLDHTIILWMTSWAGPGNRWEPMSAVLLGGRALGLRGGRYLRLPQNVAAPSDVLGGGAKRVGPPHNRLLTSVARLLGVDVDAVGDRVLIRRDDSTLDLSGPLPGL